MGAMADQDPHVLGRYIGWTMLGTIVIGILSTVFISKGININLSADITATAKNMLEAEPQLRARAYVSCLVFALEALVSAGLFLLLRQSGPLLAAWSLFVSLGASVLVLLGAMFAMNAAVIAGNPAYVGLTDESQRLMITSLQVTSDYTSFHLGLVLSTAAKAGFFYLFIKSGLIPKIIAGWGLFASVFVVAAIVGRDFVPILGHGLVTAAFMLSNLIALVATGLYLGIRGVRSS